MLTGPIPGTGKLWNMDVPMLREHCKLQWPNLSKQTKKSALSADF
ncbi:hypothetical protein [Paenibacillus sp. Y412MC10]|nr:hypothetical protein [Paenibacillus sp. Y412MC10]